MTENFITRPLAKSSEVLLIVYTRLPWYKPRQQRVVYKDVWTLNSAEITAVIPYAILTREYNRYVFRRFVAAALVFSRIRFSIEQFSRRRLKNCV